MFVCFFFKILIFFYSFFFSEADDLYSDLVLEVVQDNNIVFRKKVSKKLTLENTEGAIRNGRSREVSNVLGTQEKQKPITICVGHHYTQTNTNNINKT